MDSIFDSFAEAVLENEADVRESVLRRILAELLGYSQAEIRPERSYRVTIPLNRERTLGSVEIKARAKPDYVVEVEGKAWFVVDAKGPAEEVTDYLPQIRAYAMAVGVNFLFIANGSQFAVFDGTRELFFARDLDQFRRNFDQVHRLLSKARFSDWPSPTRITFTGEGSLSRILRAGSALPEDVAAAATFDEVPLIRQQLLSSHLSCLVGEAGQGKSIVGYKVAESLMDHGFDTFELSGQSLNRLPVEHTETALVCLLKACDRAFLLVDDCHTVIHGEKLRRIAALARSRLHVLFVTTESRSEAHLLLMRVAGETRVRVDWKRAVRQLAAFFHERRQECVELLLGPEVDVTADMRRRERQAFDANLQAASQHAENSWHFVHMLRGRETVARFRSELVNGLGPDDQQLIFVVSALYVCLDEDWVPPRLVSDCLAGLGETGVLAHTRSALDALAARNLVTVQTRGVKALHARHATLLLQAALKERTILAPEGLERLLSSILDRTLDIPGGNVARLLALMELWKYPCSAPILRALGAARVSAKAEELYRHDWIRAGSFIRPVFSLTPELLELFFAQRVSHIARRLSRSSAREINVSDDIWGPAEASDCAADFVGSLDFEALLTRLQQSMEPEVFYTGPHGLEAGVSIVLGHWPDRYPRVRQLLGTQLGIGLFAAVMGSVDSYSMQGVLFLIRTLVDKGWRAQVESALWGSRTHLISLANNATFPPPDMILAEMFAMSPRLAEYASRNVDLQHLAGLFQSSHHLYAVGEFVRRMDRLSPGLGRRVAGLVGVDVFVNRLRGLLAPDNRLLWEFGLLLGQLRDWDPQAARQAVSTLGCRLDRLLSRYKGQLHLGSPLRAVFFADPRTGMDMLCRHHYTLLYEDGEQFSAIRFADYVEEISRQNTSFAEECLEANVGRVGRTLSKHTNYDDLVETAVALGKMAVIASDVPHRVLSSCEFERLPSVLAGAFEHHGLRAAFFLNCVHEWNDKACRRLLELTESERPGTVTRALACVRIWHEQNSQCCTGLLDLLNRLDSSI